MPGTWVQDANAPELADGTDLTATGNGTGVQVDEPGWVRVELVSGTCTGTTTTCDVEIQSSDSSTFASGVISHGLFPQLDQDDDDVTRYMDAYVSKRYMREVHTITGTTPVFPLTITVRERHDHRTESDTA